MQDALEAEAVSESVKVQPSWTVAVPLELELLEAAAVEDEPLADAVLFADFLVLELLSDFFTMPVPKGTDPVTRGTLAVEAPVGTIAPVADGKDVGKLPVGKPPKENDCGLWSW